MNRWIATHQAAFLAVCAVVGFALGYGIGRWLW